MCMTIAIKTNYCQAQNGTKILQNTNDKNRETNS